MTENCRVAAQARAAAVFRIAGCITVMVNGTEVRVAYLGEH